MSGFASAGGFAMPCAVGPAQVEPPIARIIASTIGPHGLAAFAGRMVRIWSEEHRAWWREGGAGYTIHAEAAGEYAFDDAWLHVRHCGPEKQIHFDILA